MFNIAEILKRGQKPMNGRRIGVERARQLPNAPFVMFAVERFQDAQPARQVQIGLGSRIDLVGPGKVRWGHFDLDLAVEQAGNGAAHLTQNVNTFQ
jgi:hypothetical protein